MGTRTDPREMDMISTFFDVVLRVALGPVPHQQEKEKERKARGVRPAVGESIGGGGGWWV